MPCLIPCNNLLKSLVLFDLYDIFIEQFHLIKLSILSFPFTFLVGFGQLIRRSKINLYALWTGLKYNKKVPSLVDQNTADIRERASCDLRICYMSLVFIILSTAICIQDLTLDEGLDFHFGLSGAKI